MFRWNLGYTHITPFFRKVWQFLRLVFRFRFCEWRTCFILMVREKCSWEALLFFILSSRETDRQSSLYAVLEPSNWSCSSLTELRTDNSYFVNTGDKGGGWIGMIRKSKSSWQKNKQTKNSEVNISWHAVRMWCACVLGVTPAKKKTNENIVSFFFYVYRLQSQPLSKNTE